METSSTARELDDVSMVIHYRMTGQVVLEDENSRFVRVRWILESGEHIGFMDPRKFGTVDVVANDVHKWFKDKKWDRDFTSGTRWTVVTQDTMVSRVHSRRRC